MYIGKQINGSKTFREEFVENNSELFCVKCEEYKPSKKLAASKETNFEQRSKEENKKRIH